MARITKKAAETEVATDVKLPKIEYHKFRVWIVGDMPLICHAWSEKAKRQMLDKQLKRTSSGRATRDPETDFVSSLYEFDDEGHYGFPAMAVKKAMLACAHKDKGMPMTTVRAALWLHAQMIRIRPALAGAVCDMPLLRIYGPEPEMREDMVKVGSGLNKTADLSYRGQFWPWALRVAGRLNIAACPMEWLPHLIRDAGVSIGIGDWRNEKNGTFGAFHLANPKETEAWEAYAKGTGELPAPVPQFDDDEFAEAAE